MTLENEYIAARETANAKATPYAQLQARQQAEQAAEAPQVASSSEDAPAPRGAVKDIGRGVAEAPLQVVGGVIDSVNEVSNLTKDVGDWMNENVADLGGIVINEDGVSFAGGEEIAASENLANLPTTEKADSVTGSLIRGISQFLGGFGMAGKALKAAGVAAKGLKGAAIKGAVADFSAFDPQEERLSNLTQEFPALQNPVSEYLAASPDDGDAEGRFKNAIEGLGLGVVTDGLFKGLKLMRQVRLTRNAAKADEALKKTATKLAAPEKVATLPEKVKDLQGGDAPLVSVSKTKAEVADSEFADVVDDIKANLAVSDKKLDEFVDAPIGATKAVNVNLSKIDAPEDITAAIEKTGAAFSDEIDEARRGVITQEQTAKLADELGLTEEQLLARRKGQAFNAEEAIAARRIMVSSAESLRDLALLARDGGDAELLAFKEALGKHGAIQAQISGMTAEAGRTLQSFRMTVGSTSEEMVDVSMRDGNRIRDMAEKLAEVDSIYGLNKAARELEKPSLFDKAYEIWINGLLSAPSTHIVNATSNSVVALYSIPERMLAAGVNKAFGDGEVVLGEAAAQAFGLIRGSRDGFRLAAKSFTGHEPMEIVRGARNVTRKAVSGDIKGAMSDIAAGVHKGVMDATPQDPLTKVEVSTHKAISAKNFNLSGFAGQAVDYLGETIRTPGRALQSEDEFFKSVGYRMELNAQVFRQAKAEGLQGEAMAKRMSELLQDTPENIELAAVNASRYQTFTDELSPEWRDLNKGLAAIPALRIVIPFKRTPANILSFVRERSPLAPLTKRWKADIEAGGARRDMAVARMALGSTVMMIGVDLTFNGDVTGNGPAEPKARNMWKAQGNKPYSIRIGDEWFPYDRLDPLGLTLAISADYAETAAHASDHDMMTMAASVSIAIAKSVGEKTYLRGLVDLVDAFNSAKSEPDVKNSKMKRYINRQAGTLVPFSSLMGSVSREIDPVIRQADTAMDTIRKRIPGMSADLPPVLDVFGNVREYSAGIAPSFASPFKVGDDPVLQSLIDDGIGVSMPSRQIGRVELTHEQYNDYVRFSSGYGEDRTMYDEIKDIVGTDFYQELSPGPDGGREAVINTLTSGLRQQAQGQMFEKYPDLLENVIMNKIESKQ